MLIGSILIKNKLEGKCTVCASRYYQNICLQELKHVVISEVWPSTDLAALSCTVGFVTNVLHVAQADTFTDMWNLITYLAPHLCRNCISSLHHFGFECSISGIHLCCQLCIISQLHSLNFWWLISKFWAVFHGNVIMHHCHVLFTCKGASCGVIEV